MPKLDQSPKTRFLVYELGLLTLKAALSTRDVGWPIYDPSRRIHQRTEAKTAFRDVLRDIEHEYATGGVTERSHCDYISSVADTLSTKLKENLHEGRFRIGVAQKLTNLHLKYLWTAGLSPEPPHCPIDGIIRDTAGLEYNWTRSDSIEDYKMAIASLKRIAKGQSLSVWELESFRRRDDS